MCHAALGLDEPQGASVGAKLVSFRSTVEDTGLIVSATRRTDHDSRKCAGVLVSDPSLLRDAPTACCLDNGYQQLLATTGRVCDSQGSLFEVVLRAKLLMPVAESCYISCASKYRCSLHHLLATPSLYSNEPCLTTAMMMMMMTVVMMLLIIGTIGFV